MNDKAVMEAYGFWGRLNSEAACASELLKMYQALVDKERSDMGCVYKMGFDEMFCEQSVEDSLSSGRGAERSEAERGDYE